MGIVIKQSIKNAIITYVGFGIGAINTLFLFTNFLSDEYFGLIMYILSTANILMPLMAFGIHNTIIKFYTSFEADADRGKFLTLMVFLPLLVIIPFGLIGSFAYNSIGEWLAKENSMVKDYTWLIYVSAIALAYFEVFYAWAKVQLRSVFGNFMKEVFHRILISLLLIALYLNYLTPDQLVYAIMGVYVLRTIIMKLYAYKLKPPVFKLLYTKALISIIKYSGLIIIAGSIANVILEIDKFMIGHVASIENVAYYGVAIYIATVIGVPMRSMNQIMNPLTAQYLNERNKTALVDLYKKSALNLFIVSGLIFLLIVLNVKELYELIPDSFSGGLFVVFVIGLTKLLDTLIGNNNAILFNSDYYRVVLIFGVLLAIMTIILNMMFIPKFGIDGAAIATFISIFLYNAIKVIFVWEKFKMQPFTLNTFKVVLLIIGVFAVFYFWDFNFHPMINIAFKSTLFSLLFVVVVYKLKFSEDITELINSFLKR
ncbi:lipopolysaccharide biosynthesis protein [Mangrovimonas aestuarii]|uniref:lipopolysaccharide biosynthesis protein n=1 Tax=Mangrovimonas aestuarii TaxID=3018443 RepID=UPI002379F5DC|nr:polysaccharide biosynthesis C-terminal domain-containing protein [Mangrovimonas aestuarii]